MPYSDNPAFDERDQTILDRRQEEWDQVKGPRVGDYVYMRDGTCRRFTHDWGKNIQTTVGNNVDSSFYFFGEGMSFSGSLDPAIPKDRLIDLGQIQPARCWFFHHNEAGAHRGVQCQAQARVFLLPPKWRPITEEEYWSALGALPPAWGGHTRFLIGEPFDHYLHPFTRLLTPVYRAYYSLGEGELARYFQSERPLMIEQFIPIKPSDVLADIAEKENWSWELLPSTIL